MMRSIFDESVREFCDKFNWFFLIWGVLLLKVIQFMQIFR